MRANPAGFSTSQRTQTPVGAPGHMRVPKKQGSMTAGYAIVVAIGGATLFFVLLTVFSETSDNDNAWVPAGLAACIVMVLAIGARAVLFKRSRVEHIPTAEFRERDSMAGETQNIRATGRTAARNTATLRNLQKLSDDANSSNTPESHLDTFHACTEYLENAEEILKNVEISRESRAAVRSGQERVRILQRHHMVSWARAAVRLYTQEAQLRVRLSDKIETAQRGLGVIKTAHQHFPDELELSESADAIHEFIVSAQVAHWVELAERNAFRGYYKRSIDRYHDALFYLSRGQISSELQLETGERIRRQIELLRAKLRTTRESGQERSFRREASTTDRDAR